MFINLWSNGLEPIISIDAETRNQCCPSIGAIQSDLSWVHNRKWLLILNSGWIGERITRRFRPVAAVRRARRLHLEVAVEIGRHLGRYFPKKWYQHYRPNVLQVFKLRLDMNGTIPNPIFKYFFNFLQLHAKAVRKKRDKNGFIASVYTHKKRDDVDSGDGVAHHARLRFRRSRSTLGRSIGVSRVRKWRRI